MDTHGDQNFTCASFAMLYWYVILKYDKAPHYPCQLHSASQYSVSQKHVTTFSL